MNNVSDPPSSIFFVDARPIPPKWGWSLMGKDHIPPYLAEGSRDETHSVFISSCVGRRTAEIVMEGSYFAFFAEAHDIHLVFIIAAAGRNVTSLYIDRIIHLHVISVSTYGPQSVALSARRKAHSTSITPRRPSTPRA